jgi:hypothetical protein
LTARHRSAISELSATDMASPAWLGAERIADPPYTLLNESMIMFPKPSVVLTNW